MRGYSSRDSYFESDAELDSWLAFVEWMQDPEADPEAYYWCAGSWWPSMLPEPLSARAQRRPYVPRNRASTVNAWVRDTVAGLPATVTTDEACEALRMSRRNLYRIVAAGKLHARKTAEAGSSRLLIPRAEIERYLRNL